MNDADLDVIDASYTANSAPPPVFDDDLFRVGANPFSTDASPAGIGTDLFKINASNTANSASPFVLHDDLFRISADLF